MFAAVCCIRVLFGFRELMPWCGCGCCCLFACTAVVVRLQRYTRVMEEDFGPVIPGREAEAATGANEDGEFFDPALLEVRHAVVLFWTSWHQNRSLAR